MSWSGYFSLGTEGAEQEIINVARTEAYAANAGLRWFTPIYNSPLLATLLGHDAYQTPEIDGAPWFDPDDPVSNEFYGLYPTDVSGLEDSSRMSTPVESTGDGGIPGRLRYGMKTVVFSGVLIASSARGAEYGWRWLNRATAMKPCLPGSGLPDFNGDTLRYLSLDPSNEPGCSSWVSGVLLQADGGTPFNTGTEVADGGTPGGTGVLVFDGGTPTETGSITYTDYGPFLLGQDPYSPALETYWRARRKVKVNNGPRILRRRTASDGAEIWNVQMTAVTGPWEYGNGVTILQDWASGTYPYADDVDGGLYDAAGAVWIDGLCAEQVWSPLYNPLCAPIAAAPSVPDVVEACFTLPANWWRRRATIPAAYIPLVGEVVPVISVKAVSEDAVMMRIQIYADLSGSGLPQDNPCDILGDFVIGYIPEDGTLVIDGVAEAVYVYTDTSAVQRRADNLVASSSAAPMSWPQLSCGYGYIVTVDLLDDTTTMPEIDVVLVPRVD